jgi:hypothetical protein
VSLHSLSVTVTWSDVDLLEAEVALRFQLGAGRADASVTRDELRVFARSLVAVWAGASVALLEAGQPDLGYATCPCSRTTGRTA